MPLKYFNNSNLGDIAVWMQLESSSYYEDNITLDTTEHRMAASLSDRKKREFMATRMLGRRMGIQQPIHKLDNGKPIIHGDSRELSISHSQDMVALMVADEDCGIDIQKKTEKILKISRKFISNEDFRHHQISDLHHAHLCWGLKEVVFKVHADGSVDFKRHIVISEYSYNGFQGSGTALFNNQEKEYHVDFEFELWKDYVLVYGCRHRDE